MVRAPVVRGLGFHSGWGRGAAALPTDALASAAGRELLSLDRPPVEDERFRRATRECLLGLLAVEAMLEDVGAPRDTLAGPRTALLYVTAAAYAASNRLFIEQGGGTHFAYTAPAVVPAEVAIAFGITGAYAIFIGGPPETLRAIWYAASLLTSGACDRALVLAVEVFDECRDFYARRSRLVGSPRVEAAGCVWLEPGTGPLTLDCARRRGRPDRAGVRQRLGEAFACEPLAALGLWRRDRGADSLCLRGAWRGEVVTLSWPEEATTASAGSGRSG